MIAQNPDLPIEPVKWQSECGHDYRTYGRNPWYMSNILSSEILAVHKGCSEMSELVPKPWFMSKTIWIQVLTVLASLALYFADAIPSAAVWLTAAASVINTIVRTITKAPIKKGA